MAHISKWYSSHWTPDGEPGSFNATIGRIICHTDAAAAAATAAAAAAAETAGRGAAAAAAAAPAQRRAPPPGPGGGTARAAAAAEGPWFGPRPGYSWVDRRGAPLAAGPPAPPPPPPAPPRPPPPAAAELAALPPGQRSMRIWARISPGMLPGTSATPESTAAAAFKHPGQQLLGAIDFTHHLKKTDFSEYVEARERQHVSLKAKS
ncbi:hypothetical protein Rsub_03304 [Raphidocelis subcapitata]|uniref:Uncharacterized protein n=1 Tax=Raphidocelis subcapitata TaxID=307507 RepID=A0A2V0NRA7_9CHLO|nr:hypothetical protein Rsub_03304 [Raphidocelis subcapitata]|eukprot:GBF90171.1 hypothetical protein Rsub_03304 [Raphidocelis subcapitata]